jgi:2-polyprenyl-6-hydroxyphenyl methylase/3-demethylubiquinone-9 3-methyltransferase
MSVNNKKEIKITTIDPSEVDKFTAMADEWWDPNGKFKPLHKYNPVRIKYIKENIFEDFDNLDQASAKPLQGLEILDIGCGGGLLSIPFARLGAKVTGIDASEKNIKIAKAYAEKRNIDVEFLNITAEELVETGRKFDVILNMEVIEHVANVQSFVDCSCDLIKENGIMFVATLSRTPKSYLFAIIGAEYVLGWLPKGTHDWNKFLKPSEIEQMLAKNDKKVISATGVKLDIISNKFVLTKDLSVNYMLKVK